MENFKIVYFFNLSKQYRKYFHCPDQIILPVRLVQAMEIKHKINRRRAALRRRDGCSEASHFHYTIFGTYNH